jgi:hypothetical protein
VTNPVLLVPRSVWLPLMRRNPALLDDLVLCLLPYAFLVVSAFGVWLFSRNIGPADSYLVYDSHGWAERCLMAVLSIWLLAPPLYERCIKASLTRSQRLVAASVLLASCWTCVAAPIYVQHCSAARLKASISVKDLTGYLKSFMPVRLDTFSNFPDLEDSGQLLSEMYTFAHVDHRPFVFSIGLGRPSPAKELPTEKLSSLPSQYCSVASGLRIPVNNEIPDAVPSGKCIQYLNESVSRLPQDESGLAAFAIDGVNDSIERVVGTLFVLNHLGSFRVRSELASIWLWTIALGFFWTASVQFGGDLARKGIVAGLIPFWRDQVSIIPSLIPSRFSLSLRLRLDTGLVYYALPLILVAIYIFWCGSRRYFPAFPWVQFLTAIISAYGTVLFFEILEPRPILPITGDAWYFDANLIAVCIGVALLLLVESLRRRISSLAVAPV